MGVDDNGDLGFQLRVGSLLNCPSSGIYMSSQSQKIAESTMSSISTCKSSNVVESSFYSTDWDPLVSQSLNLEFKGSSMASQHHISISSYGGDVLESQGISNSSPLVRCPSDLNLIELAPKLPMFGSSSFSEMVSSFGLTECDQFANADDPSDYHSNMEGGTKIFLTNLRSFQENLPISDEEAGVPSPNEKKRKRVPPEHHAGKTHSQFDSIQSVKVEQQKDASHETLEGLKEKKPKKEPNPGTKLCGKITDKQSNDSSRNGSDPKEDYIHVRAKRGQATNSHSLAERVRREKISERMRLLQDLVPGCNKVTGKAVMLDEIINYVQSLQRQVEFLSMKLATVNPEMNIDIERILSKDILHSRGVGSAILGFGPGTTSSHPQSHIFQQESMHAIQNTHSQLSPMTHVPSIWDDELQGVIEMGFDS